MEDDVLTLARTIYGEARGEDTAGKCAVASVIMNRYRSGKWFAGKSIAETCKKKWQFSCWNDNDPNRKKIENATREQLGECYEIAQKYISGEYKDFLCGACHYHTINTMPKWAIGKSADFKIGNHLFYKGVD